MKNAPFDGAYICYLPDKAAGQKISGFLKRLPGNHLGFCSAGSRPQPSSPTSIATTSGTSAISL